jgi:hypothetical protein
MNDSFSTATLLAVFTDEVAAHGGEVRDTYNDGTRLFTRSILPRVKEVAPGDGVQGGVALKADGREVWLHPYLFRQVCRNGAIMARALQSRHLSDLADRGEDEATAEFREAISACCAEETFSAVAEEVRSARDTQADLAIAMLPMLSRFGSGVAGRMFSEIMARFFRESDRSAFGLMNAVTSLARDTRDPDLRWRLEEFGGGIPASVTRKPPPKTPARATAWSQAVAVEV